MLPIELVRSFKKTPQTDKRKEKNGIGCGIKFIIVMTVIIIIIDKNEQIALTYN